MNGEKTFPTRVRFTLGDHRRYVFVGRCDDCHRHFPRDARKALDRHANADNATICPRCAVNFKACTNCGLSYRTEGEAGLCSWCESITVAPEDLPAA